MANNMRYAISNRTLLVLFILILLLVPGAFAGTKYKTLHTFRGVRDGGLPKAGLIFDAAGNLYGTTTADGHSGFGTVFKLTPNGDGSWTESVLYAFHGPDGWLPAAGL